MPNFYNPYNFYPASYTPGYSQQSMMPQQAPPMQQSYATQPNQGTVKVMEWVEGEVGAKAFPMPPGWPANQPIPLWDSTEPNIYLKSWGPMGIPNPLQKLPYKIPEAQNYALLTSASAAENVAEMSNNTTVDTSQFVTKHDLEQMKTELQKMLQNNQNQNARNNAGNRGDK